MLDLFLTKIMTFIFHILKYKLNMFIFLLNKTLIISKLLYNLKVYLLAN